VLVPWLVQDCKLLVVAEAKAFFDLYHTLSAAGVLAVQLDRSKKLPMGPAGGRSSTCSSADPAAVAAWQSAVFSALGAASCVLATHEQLRNPCMVLQDFHVLIEYVSWEATAAGQAAAAGAGGAGIAAGSSIAAVSVQFGPGRHYIFAVQEPDLVKSAGEEVKKACQPTTAAPTPRAGAVRAAHNGSAANSTLAGPGGVQHEPSGSTAAAHAGAPKPPAAASATLGHAAAATGTHQHHAAAQDAGSGPLADAEATAEVPLVLNASAGSVVRRRQSLYQSLMQLEGQGFVLVERGLCNNSRGNTGASALVGSAVDIVLTPQACLCVWDDSKLPLVRDIATRLPCVMGFVGQACLCFQEHAVPGIHKRPNGSQGSPHQQKEQQRRYGTKVLHHGVLQSTALFAASMPNPAES
jgi:hypothetical protein